MPRPIPVPVRHALFRLWQQGQSTRHIAAALGLPDSTVRRLLARFRRRGVEGIAPDYHRPSQVEAASSEVRQLALNLRREHPTWGAGLIRVEVLQALPGRSVPSERTLQRWFVRADLSPAPPGRRPAADAARATRPHETWQMDAKEHIRLRSHEEASWLRLTDECSGAVLQTPVFPPGDLGPRPRDVRAGAAPRGVHRVGVAGVPPGRQRRAVGLDGRLPHRVVALADRVGDRDALEPPAAPPGEWGRRTDAADLRGLVRALDLRDARGTAGALGADGPPAPRGVPLPQRSQSHGVFPEPEAFGSALRPGFGGGPVAVVARDRAPVELRGRPACGPVGPGVAV
ncbi:MAG: helix-turn-helix domain-containing protein [Singulisphaera sp.]|nr:helix-turn-helix domain-containing protein [Singulisphaera sp.]